MHAYISLNQDYSSPVKSGFAETKTPTPRRSEPSSPLRIDAPELYRQIQDSLSATQFQKFAMLIGEFNSEHKSAEQTIEAISQLIRDRFCFLYSDTHIQFQVLVWSDEDANLFCPQ